MNMYLIKCALSLPDIKHHFLDFDATKGTSTSRIKMVFHNLAGDTFPSRRSTASEDASETSRVR